LWVPFNLPHELRRAGTMIFPKTFVRRVGAGAGVVLGSDATPPPALASQTGPLLDNMIGFSRMMPDGWPCDHIAVGVSYAGAGAPVSMTVRAYMWVEDLGVWLENPTTYTVLVGKIVNIPCEALLQDVITSNTPNVGTNMFALVPVAGVVGDGLYTFLMGPAVNVGVSGDSPFPLPMPVTETNSAAIETHISTMDTATTNIEGHVHSIDGKLPTLGVRTTPLIVQTVALSVAYTALRTWNGVGVVADLSPPATGGGLWTTLTDADASVEWIPQITVIGGATTPSQVTFQLWTDDNTNVVLLDQITMDTAQWTAYGASKAMRSRVGRINGAKVQVTCAFPDGAGQLLTGSVLIRRASTGHAIQRGDFIWNQATGHPVVEARSYDAVADAIRNMEVSPAWLQASPQLLESTAGALILNATTYIPAATGMEARMREHFEWLITAGGATTATVEGSCDSTFTLAKDCTKSFWDSTNGAMLTGPIVIAAGATSSVSIDCDVCPYPYIRLKFVNAGAASTACTIYEMGRVC
jgi:hypothetical protein